MAEIRRWAVVWTAAFLGCYAVGAADQPADPASVKAAAGNAPPPATDGDWPAFRGAARNGISTEADWQTVWPADGPKRLWTAEVGLGYSAVSVADGRAYTLGNRDDRETIYCFDAATGGELWKHAYSGGLVDNLHRGGPGATPTVDGDAVYVIGKEGQINALHSQTGQILWQVQATSDLRRPVPEWGFTSSPLVVGNLIVLDLGGLVALDKMTGKVVWQSTAQNAGYGSPIALPAPDGSTLVAALTNDSLTVVRAFDGVEVAAQPWTSDYTTTSTTPVVGGRTLFVSSGYGTGCALFELHDGKLQQLYRNREMSNHMCTSVLYEGYLYGIDGNSQNARLCKLVCLDHATGRRVWEQRGFGCGALMLADGKLLVMSDAGYLSIVKAAPGGYEEISRTKVFDDHTWTMPVLAQGRIYCRSESGSVVCLDVRR